MQNKGKPRISKNYSSEQITFQLLFLTLYIAAFGMAWPLHIAAVAMAWPLLGLPRKDQAALYLFQKHLLCREYIYNIGHREC
jgi:hypothetical protein